MDPNTTTTIKSGGRWRQASTVDRPPRRDPFEGERRLMVAILEDAVEAYRRPGLGARGRRLLAEVERWVEDGDRKSLFAFLNVCDYLDLDPGRVRRYLRDLRGAVDLRARAEALVA